MNTKNIAVFGSLTQDLFAYPEKNFVISQLSEKENKKLYALPYGGKINTEYLERHAGGGSANVSTSFQRLGFQSYCFGGVGDDEIGSWILKNLEKQNINTENIQHFTKCNSGFSIILNSFDGERTVIFTAQANKRFENISSSSLEKISPDALYLCHISGENPKKLFTEIEKYCLANPDVLLAWNPGKEILIQGLEAHKELFSRCDLLFLNKEEAELLTQTSAKYAFSSFGEKQRKKSHSRSETPHIKKLPAYAHDCSPMAEKILEYGGKTVIITDGSRGAQIFTKTKRYFSAPVSKERKDSLGAGDGYASAFTASMLHGKDLQKSAEYASINAASVVAFRGAQDGLLTKSELYRQ